MHKNRNLFLLILMIGLLLSACSTMPVLPEKVAKDDYQSVINALRNLIEARMQKNKIVGMEILLVNEDEVIWSEGFGYSNKEKKIKATADTPFFVGSISKLFTGTAIMQLVEQGKIDLDAPLAAYIPGFSIKSRFPDAPPITVRNLLTHHSGLPSDILKGMLLPDPPPADYKQRLYELPELLKNDYVYAPADSLFAYCNIGYSLLGIVVANVSGMDFDRYVKQNILMPLAMDHTTFIADELDSLVATGYEKGKPQPRNYIRDYPAGSLVTSANDMARFIKMIFHEGQGVLKADTFNLMLTRQNANVELDRDFPVGLTYWLITDTLPVEKTASHGGDTPPFHAMLITIPEYKIGVFTVVNTIEGAALPTELGFDAIRLMLEAKTGLKPVPPIPAPVKQLTSAEVQQMTGVYMSPMGYIEFIPGGKSIAIKLMGTKFFLIPRTDDTFSLEFRLFDFIPLKIPGLESFLIEKFNVKGETFYALYPNGILAGIMEKYKPVPISEIWKAREGTYKIINPDEVSFMDKLVLKYNKKSNCLIAEAHIIGRMIQFIMVPESDNTAISYGRGRNLGFTAAISKENDKEVISIMGFKLQKQ